MKVEAVKAARVMALGHQPAQMVVHNKTGRIAFEHTYTADPRRYVG